MATINATALGHVTHEVWAQDVVEQSLNLIAVHNRFQRLNWLANVMPMSQWQTLRGLRGSYVTLITSDPDDPNSTRTYYNARLDQLAAAGHDGPNMTGVRVEFLVQV